MRVGVVHNPLSRRNGGARSGRHRDQAEQLDALFLAPPTPEALRQGLAGFAAAGVELVVIDGGDGTVREVVTALPETFGARPPALSVLASGKTNLVAAALGRRRSGPAGLRRLVERARAQPAARRDLPALEVQWRDGSHPPVRGFFLGAAGFTRAVGLAERGAHRRGVTQSPAVALTLLQAIGQMGVSRTGRSWLAGEGMTVGIEGAGERHGGRMLFLATTLDRLILGLWPFWGPQHHPIRFLDVDAHPHRFGAALWRLMRGRPAAWMDDHYRSGTARGIGLRLDHPFILDGERFDPGGDVVEIRPSPPLSFVVP